MSITLPESSIINKGMFGANANHLTKKQQYQILQNKLAAERKETKRKMKITRRLLEKQQLEMDSIYKKR